VRLAQALLDRNVRAYGTRRANRGNPCDLEGEGKRLKKGKLAFRRNDDVLVRRNGDVLVQVWMDKTFANDKYDLWCNNCKQRRKDRKTNMEIKKPYTVGQYNKFIIAHRQGRLVPQLLLSSEENCITWSKKVVLYLLNCMLFLDTRSTELKWVKFWWPSIAREGDLNRTHQAGSPVISEYTNFKKLLLVGKENDVSCKTV